jgi:sodium transport system permease protein
LFYGSERLDLRLWLKHLYRDRKPTPTAAGALACAVVILMMQFFMNLSLVPQQTIAGLVKAVLVPQFAVILLPVLLMTFLFTSKPRETLLLKLPHWSAVPAALIMALAIQPSLMLLQNFVQHLYPVEEGIGLQMQWLQQIFRQGNLGLLILLIAVTPAVCEELAVRGFILSGLRHLGYKWRAIVISALFFGLIHGLLQQSINAFFVGIVLGYLAVQSGSIWPCMAFHLTNNSMVLLFSRITPATFEDWTLLKWLGAPLEQGGIEYFWQVKVATGILAMLMVFWFSRLSYCKTSEERLREAIIRGQETNPEDKDISISLASMIK